MKIYFIILATIFIGNIGCSSNYVRPKSDEPKVKINFHSEWNSKFSKRTDNAKQTESRNTFVYVTNGAECENIERVYPSENGENAADSNGSFYVHKKEKIQLTFKGMQRRKTSFFGNNRSPKAYWCIDTIAFKPVDGKNYYFNYDFQKGDCNVKVFELVDGVKKEFNGVEHLICNAKRFRM